MRFLGAHSLDHDLLAEAIATRASGCRSPLFFLPCMFGDFDWAERKAFLADSARIVEDAERIAVVYEIWGYPWASVTARVVPENDGDVVVEFLIDEGPPLIVDALEIHGIDTLATVLGLPAVLPLAVGEPYALPRLEALRLLLRERLAQHGRPGATVEVGGTVDEPARRARLVLEVDPGPRTRLDAPIIETVAPITENDVRERLAWTQGETYRTSSLERTQRRLYELPIVARAVVSVPADLDGDTLVAPRILVEPRRTTGFELEGTLSSTQCVELNALWRHFYFGGPRELALGAGVSNLLASQADGAFPCAAAGTGAYAEPNWVAHAELREPSFLEDQTTLMASAWIRRESAPDVYVSEGFGGSLSLGREFGDGVRGIIGVLPARNELRSVDAYYCANYGVCARDGITALSAASWLVPVQLVGLWASSELPGDVRRPDTGAGTEWVHDMLPDWRYRVRGAFEAAGSWSGSDFDYRRTIVEASATRVVGRSFELAARARAAALFGDTHVPPQVRLYSGGPQTVRGVEHNTLGPSVLIGMRDDLLARCDAAAECALDDIAPSDVTLRPTGATRVLEANAEGRLWVSDRLQVAAFLDFGRVWGSDPLELDGARFDPPAQAVLTPGIGMRVITDLGPLRLDLAYDPGGAQTLPLLARDETGTLEFIGLASYRRYTHDDPHWARSFVRRLQLQLAVGQAF